MATKITPEMIEEINELYVELGVKAQVARKIGVSPVILTTYSGVGAGSGSGVGSGAGSGSGSGSGVGSMALKIASQVEGPHIPSTYSPLSSWKDFTALSVILPNNPSAPYSPKS